MYVSWGHATAKDKRQMPTPAFYANPENVKAFAKWFFKQTGTRLGTKELRQIMQQAAVRDGMPAEWIGVTPEAVQVERIADGVAPKNPVEMARELRGLIGYEIYEGKKGATKLSRRFMFVNVTAAHKPATVLQELGAVLISDEFVETHKKELYRMAGKTSLSTVGLKKLLFRAAYLNGSWVKSNFPTLYDALMEEIPEHMKEPLEQYGLNARRIASLDPTGRASFHIDSAQTVDATVSTVEDSWSPARGVINKIWRLAWDDRDALFQAYEYVLRVSGAKHVPARNDLRVQLALLAGRDRRFIQVLALGVPDPQGGGFITPGGFGWLMAPLRPTQAQVNAHKTYTDKDGVTRTRSDKEAAVEAAWQNQRDAVMWMIAHTIIERHAYRGRKAMEAAEAAKEKGKKPDFADVKPQELTSMEGEVREAMEIIQEIRERRGHEIAVLQEAHSRYIEWADALLEYAVIKNYISRAEMKRIKDSNEYYVALNRVMTDPMDINADEGAEFFARIARGDYSGAGDLMQAHDAIHAMEGSQRRIQDPYISLAQNTRRMMNEIDRNHVKATLLMPMLPDGVLPAESTEGEALETLSVFFGSIARPVSSAARHSPDVIEVRLPTADGKVIATYWKIPDKSLREALEGTKRPGSQVINFIAKIVHVARSAITKNPQFVLRNLIRDVTAANLIYGSMAPIHASAYRMAKEINEVRKGKLTSGNRASIWRQLELWGGGQFGFFMADGKAYRGLIEEALSDGKTVLLSPWNLKGLWQRYDRLLSAGESAARMEAFRRHAAEYIRQHGDDPDFSEGDAFMYAAWKARGLLDFAVGGSLVKELNQVMMFLNPQFQGLRIEARTMMKPAGFARVMTMSLLGVGAELWWNEQQDALEELATLPLWRRIAFWNLKVGDYFIMIPKPFGLFAAPSYVFSHIGLRYSASEMRRRGDVDRARSITAALDVDVKTGFHRHSVYRHMFQFLSPVDPDIAMLPGTGALFYNYDRWRDRQIVPPWEMDQPVSERVGTKYASGLSQFLSKLAGESVDPRHIDHIVSDFFGWYGKVAMDLTKSNPNYARILGLGFIGESAGTISPQAQYAADTARRFRSIPEAYSDDVLSFLTNANHLYSEAKTAKERAELAKDIREAMTTDAEYYMDMEKEFSAAQREETELRRQER